MMDVTVFFPLSNSNHVISRLTDIFINFALASAKRIRKDMFIYLQIFFSLKQF